MEENRIVFTSKLVEEIKKKQDEGILVPQHQKFWFGNMTNVKKANLKIMLTADEEMEYYKCKLGIDADGFPAMPGSEVVKSGLEYFAEKFCKIKREDGSVGELRLRDYQTDIMKLYDDNRFSILMGSRQIGKCIAYDTLVETENGMEPIFEIYYRHVEHLNIYDKIKYWLYKAAILLSK